MHLQHYMKPQQKVLYQAPAFVLRSFNEFEATRELIDNVLRGMIQYWNIHIDDVRVLCVNNACRYVENVVTPNRF